MDSSKHPHPGLPAADKDEIIRLLEQELSDTNREVLALTLELDKRIDELRRRETELSEALAEKTRLLEQLAGAKKSAEDANLAKSDFLARMSHEIRTPMNLIMGMNALLLESPLGDKQRQHVEISYRNVRRLLRLINGILDLSKVEAGELSFEAVPFDLAEVLNECAATILSAVERKGLAFEVSLHLDTWRYWVGDHERLQQVLLNLIGNSVKFTAHGKVELRVRPETGPRGEPGLRFEVTDTGPGVPPEKAALIFEAFQQGESSMNRRYEGTGLGLAIARMLVERMSGKIWVEQKSAPGAKFVFTVFLPLSSEAAVRDKAAAAAASKSTHGLEANTRLLIVEDNPENIILLEAYLENLSLSLDFAANGAEALEQRRQFEYNLILMDIQMPVMDGYTATREIRAWEKANAKPPVPIVALTAHALSGAVEQSLAAGCDGHVSKPVERHELVEAVAKFARTPAPPRQQVSASIQARRPAFLANRQSDLEKMRAALAESDFNTVRIIGHNCKGVGTGYGFPEISALGLAIEMAAKANDANQLQQSLAEFERCLAEAARQ